MQYQLLADMVANPDDTLGPRPWEVVADALGIDMDEMHRRLAVALERDRSARAAQFWRRPQP